jgi:hypothetical protein
VIKGDKRYGIKGQMKAKKENLVGAQFTPPDLHILENCFPQKLLSDADFAARAEGLNLLDGQHAGDHFAGKEFYPSEGEEPGTQVGKCILPTR